MHQRVTLKGKVSLTFSPVLAMFPSVYLQTCLYLENSWSFFHVLTPRQAPFCSLPAPVLHRTLTGPLSSPPTTPHTPLYNIDKHLQSKITSFKKLISYFTLQIFSFHTGYQHLLFSISVSEKAFCRHMTQLISATQVVLKMVFCSPVCELL